MSRRRSDATKADVRTGRLGNGLQVIARGRVLNVSPDEVVTVDFGETAGVRRCEVLRTTEEVLHLSVGDTVIVLLSSEGVPVIAGRIGPSVDPAPPREAPDELLLEARKGLVLRVGEGSIEIRADGKILIKGKDLVSHAKRMNRIKGGSVSLN